MTAPPGREVVANGVRLAPFVRKDGRVDTTWDEDRPIPTYAMVIAAGPLVMYDLGQTACGYAEDGGCVPQMVWTAPEQAKFMPGNFAHAGAIVEFFARTVGAFPYEKLGHLQTTTRYGGMENSSAIFYADQLFRRANGLSDGLIAHETAHQWFGDAVTEREWAHAWLSEGFATFFAALWTQHAHGDSAYRAELTQIRRQVIAAPVAATRAVIDSVETDPNRLLNANTYQKGGFVLHMLRTQLGDSAFFGGLRAYFAEHKNGNAMTQDLQRALERTSGRALGWFFDQWLRRPCWAEVRTSWQWDAATRRVTLDVEQGARFGAYRMPVTVEVTNADGTHARAMVALDAVASQRVLLPGEFAARPAALAFDPDVALLATFVAR
ncbi:MAG: M1 family aminopeptidase [Gemmatimonadaceae bacterium]